MKPITPAIAVLVSCRKRFPRDEMSFMQQIGELLFFNETWVVPAATVSSRCAGASVKLSAEPETKECYASAD